MSDYSFIKSVHSKIACYINRGAKILCTSDK